MIYLIRHGLDDETTLGGWSDVDLLPEGIKQVEESINKLHELNYNFSSIYSSGVKRANHTAKMIADSYHMDYSIIDGFKEQNKGLLNGYDKSLLHDNYPFYEDANNVLIDTKYPEGESLLDLYNRIKDNLDILESLEDNSLIVTHRGVINMYYYIFNNIPLDMDKGKFNVNHASVHAIDLKNKTITKII